MGVSALVEENAQLRELVKLSKIVIKNVADRK